jgi:hypothetical protein
MLNCRSRGLKGIVLSLLVASLFGCAEEPSSGEKASSLRDPGPKLGQALILEYGQVVALKDARLKVGFVSVTSESRCPSDPEVKCVWEGYAQIAVQLDEAGNDTALMKLNTPNPLREKYPSRKRYLDYTVKLGV